MKTQIRDSGTIDFNSRCGGALNEASDSRWNDDCRTLTGDQFAGIIQSLSLDKNTAHPVIQVVGLHVRGNLDLRGVDFSRIFSLKKSRLDGAMLLDDSHFQRSIMIDQLFLAEQITARNIRADGDFTLTRSQIVGSADFHHAHIAGDVVMTGSAFFNDFNIDSAAINGSLLLDNVHLSGRLLMSNESVDRNSGAQIGQSAFFTHSIFERAILGNEIRVGQDLNITSASCNEVWLVAARIDGFLKMSGTAFNGKLQVGNLRVGNSVVAGNATFHEDVFLDAATALVNIRLDGARFYKLLSATELDVRGRLTAATSIFQGPVDLTASKIGWRIEMNGASFAQTFDAVDLLVQGRFDLSNATMAGDLHLARSQVGDSLDLHGAQFAGAVDLTAMTIGHDLTLVQFKDGVAISPIRWAAPVTGKNLLLLLNAHVGALTDGTNAWPAALQYDLNGLTYGKLWLWPISLRMDWLDRGNGERHPQPYRQMAELLTATGERDAAFDVQFHGRQQERKEAWKNGHLLRCFSLAMLEVTVGYGIGGFAFRVMLWVLALLIVGWLILLKCPAARQNGIVWCAGASLNRLLPVVELNEEFKEFFKDPHRERLRNWQLMSFAAIALLGWILSLFLVAALTGLTQSG